jgi:uncharacterized membrane protein (DUF441 family)
VSHLDIALEWVGRWVAHRRKALIAFTVPVVVAVAARHGLDLSDEQIMALVAILSTGAVYAVPNREQG